MYNHSYICAKTFFCLAIIFFAFFSFYTVKADDPFDITVGSISSPLTLSLSTTADARVRIEWTRGINADYTLIRRKPDSFPIDRTDGDFIYNSTGELFIDGTATPGNTYCYRLWSYNTTYSIYSSPVGDCIHVVAAALFDVRDIIVTDNVVPNLEISCTVENVGSVIDDFVGTWVLTRVDTGDMLDAGGDTFAVGAGVSTIYTINPSTNYVGRCRIVISGNGATASHIFNTNSPPSPGPGPAPPPTPIPDPPVTPPPPTPVRAYWFEMFFLISILSISMVIFYFFIIFKDRKKKQKT